MDVPKDINYKILLELEDKDLVKFCQVNKKANKYCNDDTFWLNRILLKFPYIPIETLKNYKGEQSWAKYYIYDLRKINESRDRLQLNISSYNGRLDHVMILTQNGVRTPAATDNAAHTNQLSILKYLLSKGYKINPIDLITAVSRCHLDIVKYLVENGAGVNIDYMVGTPLEIAYEYGCQNIADYLISQGAKIKPRNV